MPLMVAKRNRAAKEARFRTIWVPMSKLMDVGPDWTECSMNLSAISSSAWSQVTRSHLPGAPLTDPLHRVEDPLLAVHVLGVAQALLAAARTVVGRVLRPAVLALLLLAPDDAVLHVDVEGAGAGAVRAVGAVGDPVPGPLAAHQVFPGAVDRPWQSRAAAAAGSPA